jgi:hypothetical protein
MIATQSKYMVVGNGRIPKFEMLRNLPNTKIETITAQIPEWFRTYNGRKIIKIYGTQLYQIYGNYNFQDYQFDSSTPLEATIHSNITKDGNTGLIIEPLENLPPAERDPGISPDYWEPTGPFSGTVNDIYENYVLTANNFYTPKTYEYTDTSITEVKFWFKNRYGVKIPIFYVYNPENGGTDFMSTFLIFKIELELMTI